MPVAANAQRIHRTPCRMPRCNHVHLAFHSSTGVCVCVCLHADERAEAVVKKKVPTPFLQKYSGPLNFQPVLNTRTISLPLFLLSFFYFIHHPSIPSILLILNFLSPILFFRVRFEIPPPSLN